MTNNDYPLTLICHPATPAPIVRALEARACWQSDGALALAFRLWGDMARLRVPAERPAQRADLLWEHTCFEAFVGVPDQEGYREFNFSPSGLWASYAFTGYRQRDQIDEERDEKPQDSIAPRIVTRRFAGHLEVDATIPAGALPANSGELLLGLCAVVEAADTIDGSHSYWALRHPAERPDFHHRDALTLHLAVPRHPL